jgi:hypothetical protein
MNYMAFSGLVNKDDDSEITQEMIDEFLDKLIELVESFGMSGVMSNGIVEEIDGEEEL